jgi:hypothetical protein
MTVTTETATYTLSIDWNGDGDYGDAGEDVTSDMLDKVVIDRGFSDPLARMTRVGRLSAILNNVDQDYSPPLAANVRPRRKVKFEMTYDGTTTTLFAGYLTSIKPTADQYSADRVTMIECVDDMKVLDTSEGAIALVTDVYADEVIDDVINAVYDSPPTTDFQAGINLFPTSSDRWSWEREAANGPVQDIRASDKVLDACTADWGKFFFAGDGKPTFINRHQMPLDAAAELTLDDTMIGLDYEMSETQIFNYIEVTCHPRRVGSSPEVLGKLSDGTAPIIEAGASRTFTIRYQDPSNIAVSLGGKDAITPVASTDYECTSDEGGEGDDETSNVTSGMDAYGDHAEVTLTNGAAHAVYVQTLRVRGYAVRARSVTLVEEDATSQGLYGKLRLPIDAVLISSEAEAASLADFLLDYYKDPRGMVRNVQFLANYNATMMAAARDLELVDRVDVTETQVGLSSFEGFIYGLRHEIDFRTGEHVVSMDLEEAYDYGATAGTWNTSTWQGGDVWIY